MSTFAIPFEEHTSRTMSVGLERSRSSLKRLEDKYKKASTENNKLIVTKDTIE